MHSGVDAHGRFGLVLAAVRNIECTFTHWKVSLRRLEEARGMAGGGGGGNNPGQVDGLCLFIPIRTFFGPAFTVAD